MIKEFCRTNAAFRLTFFVIRLGYGLRGLGSLSVTLDGNSRHR